MQGKHDRHTYEPKTYNFDDTFACSFVRSFDRYYLRCLIKSILHLPRLFHPPRVLIQFNSTGEEEQKQPQNISVQSARNVFSTYCPKYLIVWYEKKEQHKTWHSSFGIHCRNITLCIFAIMCVQIWWLLCSNISIKVSSLFFFFVYWKIGILLGIRARFAIHPSMIVCNMQVYAQYQ